MLNVARAGSTAASAAARASLKLQLPSLTSVRHFSMRRRRKAMPINLGINFVPQQEVTAFATV